MRSPPEIVPAPDSPPIRMVISFIFECPLIGNKFLAAPGSTNGMTRPNSKRSEFHVSSVIIAQFTVWSTSHLRRISVHLGKIWEQSGLGDPLWSPSRHHSEECGAFAQLGQS